MTKAERIEDITEDTTEICLVCNWLGSEGAKAVAKALEGCKNLTDLILNNNNIGSEGAKAVAKALEGCKNLTYLYLNNNNIGSEGAKAVAKALEGCKNLQFLALESNNIGSEGAKAVAKALEGCKNLQTLDLNNNNIGSEGAKAVAKALEGCKNLQFLALNNNNIGSEGAKAVTKALEGCKNLTYLSLNNNNIGSEGAKAVAKALEGCKNLTYLYLNNNNIGSEGAKAVAKALEGCKNLQTLALHENNISDEGTKAVAKALEGCKNLQFLALQWNNIGDEGAKAVAKALEGCKNLQTLHLRSNNIGSEGAKAVAKALEGCKNLQTLDLGRNKFGDEIAKAVAKALEGCKNLQTLDLGSNNIGSEGAKAVAKALEGCKNLTYLSLGSNNIGSEGAKAVAKALEGCKNLQRLYLNNNNIGSEGAKAVTKALEGCKNLTYLSLYKNNIGSEGAKAVAKALEGCKNLQTLDLSENNIGSEGAKAVAKALEVCENLQTLDLQENGIGSEGAKAVAKALEGCMNLQTLDLQYNNIGDEGAKAVAKALEGCKNLQELDLSGNNIGSEGAKAVAKSLHKACPSVKISFDGLRSSLTPKRLFERVCSPGEDITDSSLDADSVETAESEPSAEPKNNQDGVHRAGVATLDGSGERPDGASVSFADVVQLAKNVSNLRAGRGGVRGNSLQTGIALLEEFIRPAIQGYFGQVKLRQVSADIKNSKQCLDALQGQIRASSANDLPSLIEKRNAERDRLRLLMQVVYPWTRANLCESDEDVVRDFKMRIESLVHDLKITLAPVTEKTSTNDFKHCQELVARAVQCVEGYKRNGDGRPNNIGERSQQAAKCVVSRLSELELGDGLWVALRIPEQAMNLGPELSELERALQEEIEVLQGDTLSAHLSKILCAISSTFARFESYCENTVLNEASKCTPQELSELYDYTSLGLKEPSVLDVDKLYQKLGKSREATKSLKRAREELEAEDLEEEEREYFRNRIKKQKRILSKGNPIELSKVFRHKLAETLQHAQEHYPELLQDRAWLEKLHVAAEGVFEVACSDLWLTNVTVSDFQRVGEPLSFRGGKKVQKVLDNVGKTMVLKEFQLGHPSQSKTFYQQVANLGKVVSQHVIRITGAFVDMTHGESRGCIVMPFYEQGDLAKWIESHPNEGKEARDRLAVGLLVGVADLHAHGIVHCDIKPENIFLTSNGTPLIGDFDGIKVANYTATYTSLQATPRYIAPELQNGPVHRFETAMDMYSVGISLKELYPTERTAAMQTLIEALTATDPSQRPSARQALQHEAFGAPQIPLKECLVCFEKHRLSEGTSCEEGDFLCRGCIESAVEAAAQPLANVRVDADGTMACMKPGCSGKISGQEITRLAPTALNHLLLIAKMKAESEAAVWAEKEIQRRIAEVLRAEEQNSDAQRHLLHIQENILSTCCPNCKAYVHDFDGCCAVKCGNNACGHLFCAWCLGYSSQDGDVCHAHVRTCSRRLGQDLYFPGSLEQVREAWRLLRAERLREYWNAQIQDRNLRLVLKDLLSPLLTPDIVGADFRLE